jgi:integrase/recombinase XerC
MAVLKTERSDKMAKAKIVKVKYFTKERKSKINPENQAKYDKYLKSNIIKNSDVKDTTYKTYAANFMQFLVYISEQWDNVDLYSKDFFDNAIDIMEGFMTFCVDTLKNNKKAVNNKLAAVSTFYVWSMKRGLIKSHPFDNKLDRMKNASDEHIINSYFLNDEQIDKIKEGLEDTKRFDIMDKLLFNIALDSANRIGALDKLMISNLDMDNCVFTDVREKRGYHVEVAISEETLQLIHDWFEMRKDIDNLSIDAIFISKYDGVYRKMGKTTLQRRITKIGTIIGIEDFHAHCMRKTSLNSIYEKTGDLSLAAEMGNHKSIETTRQSYIKPVSKAQVRERIKEMMNKRAKESKVEDVDTDDLEEDKE